MTNPATRGAVMSWPRQVVHVAMKDLRGSRWILLVYAAYVVQLTLGATVWVVHDSSWLFATGVLFFPFSMCVAAQFVLADSPVRADAFWATRPLAPSAVIGAKVLAIVVGMLLPSMVGELIVLAVLRMAPWSLVNVLLSGLFTQFWVLLMAMTVAVLVCDLRAFLAVVIIGVVCTSLTPRLLPATHFVMVPRFVDAVYSFVPLLCCLLVIGYQYATRNTRRARQVAAGAAVWFMLPVSTTSAPSMKPSGMGVRATVASHPTWTEVHLIAPDLTPGERVALIETHVYVERADGRRDTVTLFDSSATNAPELRLAGRPHWLRAGMATDVVALKFALTPRQRSALVDSANHLRVEGTIVVDSQSLLATLPLRDGATSRNLGVLIRVGGFTMSNGATVPMRRMVVDVGTDESPASPGGALSYALVNPARREAVAARDDGSNANSVILPLANQGTASESRLEVDPRPRGSVSGVDMSWVEGAQLDVIKWGRVRSYPVSIAVKP